jgi:hypothetical protein
MPTPEPAGGWPPNPLASTNPGVIVDYTNWRGVRKLIYLRPLGITFGRNQYHPEPTWLLIAEDLNTNTVKTYAMGGVHAWDVPDGYEIPE